MKTNAVDVVIEQQQEASLDQHCSEYVRIKDAIKLDVQEIKELTEGHDEYKSMVAAKATYDRLKEKIDSDEEIGDAKVHLQVSKERLALLDAIILEELKQEQLSLFECGDGKFEVVNKRQLKYHN